MRLRAASNDERLFVCYEAGYDGFWLARSLAAEGVDCRVLDPASLQVNRRARRVKTGRIDVLMLVIAIDRGDGHVCAIVNVPTLPSGTSAIDPRAHRPYQPHQGPSLRAGRSRRRTCSTQTYRFFRSCAPAKAARWSGSEKILAFAWREGVECDADGFPQNRNSACGCRPQQGLELGERHFDGAEVRRVGREIHQRRTGRFDGLPNAKLPNQH
jgi:hypothetical protein